MSDLENIPFSPLSIDEINQLQELDDDAFYDQLQNDGGDIFNILNTDSFSETDIEPNKKSPERKSRSRSKSVKSKRNRSDSSSSSSDESSRSQSLNSRISSLSEDEIDEENSSRRGKTMATNSLFKKLKHFKSKDKYVHKFGNNMIIIKMDEKMRNGRIPIQVQRLLLSLCSRRHDTKRNVATRDTVIRIKKRNV